jgi:hypothetical protein
MRLVWHDLLGLAFGLMIASWLPSLALRRWLPRLASTLAITASLIGRVAVGGVFVAIAAKAGERGGYWLLVTAFFSVFGLLSFALAGLTVFLLLRRLAD